MKRGIFSMSAQLVRRALLLAMVCGLPMGAALASTSTSANYGIVADSMDAGGIQASSANYVGQGSVGAIGGLTTVASPAETMKLGYLGQLYQVTGLVLNTSFVDNGTTQQLSASQALDDGTTVVLTGASLSWSVVAGQLPAGLMLNSSTGVISGTPTGPGAYSFTVLVTDGRGDSGQQTFSFYPTTFAQWEAEFPQLTELSPTGTPQKDGVDNLLKYLFDINPGRPMSSTDRAALPTMGIDTTSTPGAQYLALTYRQYQSLEGVTVAVQTSTDLMTWTTVNPPDLRQQVGIDSNTGDRIIEVGILIPPGTQRQFIRLSVTQP
jgi:hypothetical protein